MEALPGQDGGMHTPPRRYSCVHFLQCIENHSIVAVWVPGESQDGSSARLTLQHSTLSYITELVTTLILNRMALQLNWDA